MINNKAALSNALFLLIAAFSLILIGAAFWSGLFSLHGRWMAFNESYSHGYLIVAMAFYSIYQLNRFDDKAPEPTLLAVPFALALSLLAVAAFAVQVQLIQQAVLPLVLLFWCVAVFGWRRARLCLAPILLLYLAVPLWDFLTLPLREMTVVVVQQSLDWLSVPAFISGFRINLPSGTLEVADGCAGLNYMLVSLVIGCYYAHTTLVNTRHKAITLLLMIAIALVGNWVRVLILVLIAYYTEMQHPVIANHGSLGWAVYCVFLVTFFVFIAKVNWPNKPVLKQEVPANSQDIKRLKVQMVSMSAVTMAFVVVPLWLNISTSNQQAVDIDLPALTIFTPVSEAFGANFWRPNYRGYDHRQLGSLELGGRKYQLSVLTYINQRQGKELIYYKNTLAKETWLQSLEPLELSSGLTVNQSVVTSLQGRQIVWWGYLVGDYYTHSPVIAKILQFPALMLGKPQASLVTLATPCRQFACDSELAELNKQPSHLDMIDTLAKELKGR